MSETITNLQASVTLESPYSLIYSNGTIHSQDTKHLSETTIVSAFNDTSLNKGIAKVGIKTNGEIVWGSDQTFLSSSYPSNINLVPISATEFIVVYKNTTHTYGYARLGTVDTVNKTITWGTVSSAFGTGAVDYISASKIDTNKIVITYQDAGVTSYGRAVICSNSSGTLSFGTIVSFTSSTTTYPWVITLSTTAAFVCYYDGTNGAGVVLSISGTTITVNTPANFNAASTSHITCDALSSTSVVVGYADVGTSGYAKVCVCTISGTTITWGSETTVTSSSNAGTADCSNRIVALSSTQFTTTYKGSSSLGQIYLYNVSGTTATKVGTDLQIWATGDTEMIVMQKITDSLIAYSRYYSGKVFYTTISKTSNGLVINSNCKILATGKTGGYTEISSVYFNMINGTFKISEREPRLYLNGVLIENIIIQPFRENYDPEYPKSVALLLPNSPIILDDGDILYASVYDLSLGFTDFPCTVSAFGIDTVVA